jgi:hypothetical protein
MGLMYLFDPDLGRRRRSLLRDKFVGTANDLNRAIDVMLRDSSNRFQGMLAEVRSLLSEEEVSGQKLAERIRTTLGRYVSHPKAIEVTVENNRVILSGPVLAGEVDRLLSAVASVRGVGEVENRLEVHEHPGNVPSLQGQGAQPGEPSPFTATNWTPATRLAASLIGGGLVLRALRRPNLLNLPLGAIGIGLFTRALGNLEGSRLAEWSGRRLRETLSPEAGKASHEEPASSQGS